jgi:hypothetical protein
MPTALEIAQKRNAPMSLGVLTQVITAIPLFAAFDVRTTPRTRFKTLALVGLPDVDPFVNLGDGFKRGKAIMALREFGCAYMGGSVVVQADVAREWQAENEDLDYDYFTLQASTRIQADLIKVERQIIYGTAENAKGFPGLKQMTPGTRAALVMSMTDTPDDSDFTKTVINAAGTTAGTASSVYSVRSKSSLDVQLVIGGTSGNAELFEFGERRMQSLPPDPAKPEELAEHEIAQYSGHIGLSVSGFSETAADQVPGQYVLRRLMNLTNDNDKGLDDYKLEKLLLSHPSDNMPTMFAMSHRSGDQWAKSRGSTGSVVFVGNMGAGRDGVVNRAPKRPTEFDGIPVVYSRAIRNNDAIEVPA